MAIQHPTVGQPLPIRPERRGLFVRAFGKRPRVSPFWRGVPVMNKLVRMVGCISFGERSRTLKEADGDAVSVRGGFRRQPACKGRLHIR